MRLLLLLLLVTTIYATTLKRGDYLPSIKMEDQFSKMVEIKNQKFLVMSWDKKNSILLNAYFEKNMRLIMSERAAYLVDVSAIPSVIHRFFAKPKMKTYPFSILQAENKKYNSLIPYKENSITVLRLNALKVEEILFIEDISTLDLILDVPL